MTVIFLGLLGVALAVSLYRLHRADRRNQHPSVL